MKQGFGVFSHPPLLVFSLHFFLIYTKPMFSVLRKYANTVSIFLSLTTRSLSLNSLEPTLQETLRNLELNACSCSSLFIPHLQNLVHVVSDYSYLNVISSLNNNILYKREHVLFIFVISVPPHQVLLKNIWWTELKRVGSTLVHVLTQKRKMPSP